MKNLLVKIFILLLAFSCKIFSQENNSINIYSKENILKFADHLFCQADYLRAVNEYQRFLSHQKNDTIKFKIALANSRMKNFDAGETGFEELFSNSNFSDEAKFEFLKLKFINNKFDDLQNLYNKLHFDELKNISAKLFYLSYLAEENSNLPNENIFINSFDEDEITLIKNFYKRKKEPNYKSKTKAALLSTILPGAGKIYAKDYGDGITAFLLNGILAYISYDNFKADHKFRGWFWGSMAALFYAGNIYGSAASANIYNAKIDVSLNSDLNIFLKNNNYFSPDYEFCK